MISKLLEYSCDFQTSEKLVSISGKSHLSILFYLYFFLFPVMTIKTLKAELKVRKGWCIEYLY